jgi:hypothetical protein
LNATRTLTTAAAHDDNCSLAGFGSSVLRRLYAVMYSGAWLPRSAWKDPDAWERLINWINENCEYLDLRLIVTPRLDNQLDNPQGLRRIAHHALRQGERSQDLGINWLAGDGPIFIVWPKERTVKKWVQQLAGLSGQSIILLEQERSDDRFPRFHGWATAIGAFNAATGKNEQPIPELDEQLDTIFTQYENELALPQLYASRAYPNSAPILQKKLQALHADGYDDDFIVTYAIALGYQGDLKRLRLHYWAAGS